MLQTSPTVDIIDDIVSALLFNFETTSVTNNLDGTYTLTACDTYYLQAGFNVEINSISYPIVSVVRNTNIVVSGTVEPPLADFAIYEPHFYHGTPNQVSNELTEIPISSDKTPMVYLSEELEETYFAGDSAYDREAPCRIFFLTQANFTGWLTEDYHTHAINPMRELATRFVDRCKTSRLIGKITSDWKITTRQKIAIVSSGSKKNFTNECLSGVELNITLPIRKGAMACPCNIIVTDTGMTWEEVALMTWEDLVLLDWEDLSG